MSLDEYCVRVQIQVMQQVEDIICEVTYLVPAARGQVCYVLLRDADFGPVQRDRHERGERGREDAQDARNIWLHSQCQCDTISSIKGSRPRRGRRVPISRHDARKVPTVALNTNEADDFVHIRCGVGNIITRYSMNWEHTNHFSIRWVSSRTRRGMFGRASSCRRAKRRRKEERANSGVMYTMRYK